LSWLVVVAVSAVAVAGCNSGSDGAGGGGGASHNDGWAGQTNIENIFDATCSGCHGSSFASCWDVHDDASNIEGAVASGSMPRAGGFAASDKAALLHWLRAGAHCSGTRPAGTGGGGGGSTISGQPPVGL
jgi:hypothetical protein